MAPPGTRLSPPSTLMCMMGLGRGKGCCMLPEAPAPVWRGRRAMVPLYNKGAQLALSLRKEKQCG